MRIITKSMMLSLLLAASSSAVAEFKGLGDKVGWTLGLAYINDWSAYKGVELKNTTTVPYFAYHWENASAGVQGFNYEFFENDNVSFSALVEPRWSFTDPQDSPIFTNIERDVALEAGIDATWALNFIELSTRYYRDVSGVHNGSELVFEASVNGGIDRLEFSVGLGYAYKSSSLNNHLYGVSMFEAKDDIAAFDANSQWQPIVSVELFYQLNTRSGLLVFAQYERIHSSLLNSPLVAKNRDASTGIAYIFKF